MACTLNTLYDGQLYYKRALENPEVPSSRRKEIPTVKKKVVDYLTERSQKAWRRGGLNPRESADWPRFGTYASMVWDDKQPVPLDLDGDKIGLPEEGLAASVPLLDILPAAMGTTYAGKIIIKTSSDEKLATTKRCVMVKEGSYVKLITKITANWNRWADILWTSWNQRFIWRAERWNEASSYSGC